MRDEYSRLATNPHDMNRENMPKAEPTEVPVHEGSVPYYDTRRLAPTDWRSQLEAMAAEIAQEQESADIYSKLKENST